MKHSEMTEADKVIEIDRQIRKGGPVFCPWCRAMNVPNSAECCVAFRSCVDDRAAAQLNSVINQQAAIARGDANALVCPYCASMNVAPEPGETRAPCDWKRPMVSPFCCGLLDSAVRAIIERQRTEAYIHHADKLGESVDKAARN